MRSSERAQEGSCLTSWFCPYLKGLLPFSQNMEILGISSVLRLDSDVQDILKGIRYLYCAGVLRPEPRAVFSAPTFHLQLSFLDLVDQTEFPAKVHTYL